MNRATKKLFLILAVAVAALTILFVREARRAATIAIKGESLPLISPWAIPFPEEPDRPVLGNPGAPMTLSLFTDVNHAYSRELTAKMIALVERRPQEVRLRWYNLPRPGILTDKTMPHRALVCASASGRFWNLAKLLIDKKAAREDKTILALGNDFGFTAERWQACLTDSRVTGALGMDRDLGRASGVKNSPALFVDNKRINITKDLNVVELVEKLLTP